MRKWLIAAFFLLSIFVLPASNVFAQSYLFNLDQNYVNVFWNEDGTTSIDYVFVFTNNSNVQPIDYVDVGLPNSKYDLNSIYADVNGEPVYDISTDFQGEGGSGFAIGLGPLSIQSGETSTVHTFIGIQRDVLYRDDDDQNYVSAVFIPTYFGRQFVQGATDLCLTYHFPPGVGPEDPRWHAAPSGFPSEPETGFDADGRVTYTWCNTQANAYAAYTFGASFPKELVPDSAVVTPSIFETLGINLDDCIGVLFCGGFGLFIAAVVGLSIRSTTRRKLQYLPPKIAIEGHGIKRGLTAVEAAILLEQPMDKILTMILFSTIKKNAATVKSRDPLEVEVSDPLPEGLHTYEVKYLEAFKKTNRSAQRKALQDTMIDLVKSVSNKMKGFSRRETIAYYKDIVLRAWAQVEAADTPQVKSERYNEVMDWTMLDDDYDRRTRDIFRTGPVFVPIWWPRYDPGFPRTLSTTTSVGKTISAPSGGGSLSLPNLPGSAFAASVIGGVQSFSTNVVGSITDFTGGVTQKTNPPPVRTSSGGGFRGGGGSSCACACACAGCACACAGGGR